MRLRRVLTSVAALLCLAAGGVQAQDARAALLRQATAAYDDFDVPRAARLARAALDPSLGARDSVWTRGVHLLTQLLIESEQEPQARLWARWAVRLEPTLAIDSVNFLGRVVSTLRAARDSTVRTAADAAVRETYVWPAATAATSETRLRLAPSDAATSVLVRGVGVLASGTGLVVEPGRYDLEISAAGFLPLRVAREVLPGVTTELSFALTPIAAAAEALDAAARERAMASVVTLSVTRYGTAARCAVGVVIGEGGLIAAPYEAIRGADSVAMVGGAGNLRVAAWDRAANLAVLYATGLTAPVLEPAPIPVDGQALFAMGRSACDALQEGRAVVRSATSTEVLVDSATATVVAGAAMVDFGGRFAGFYAGAQRVTGRGGFAPLLLAADVNIARDSAKAPRDVATAEKQRYGVVVLTSPTRGSTLRVEPLESWQWPAAEMIGPSPLTFAGPSGRYRVHIQVSGAPTQTQEITVVAGTQARTTLAPRPVAAATQPGAQAAPRRIPKWVWYVAIGAGAAAGLALGGGGGGDAGPSVIISVPNP